MRDDFGVLDGELGDTLPADVRAILRERARQLAAVPPAADGGTREDAIVCEVRGERYAIPLPLLLSVHAARALTPVPNTPPHVAGILNVRGQIVTVLDLANALGIAAGRSPADEAARGQVVLAHVSGNQVGLLVGAVVGIEQLDSAALDPALSGRDFARGVAGGNTVVLDLAHLVNAERFIVYDEAT